MSSRCFTFNSLHALADFQGGNRAPQSDMQWIIQSSYVPVARPALQRLRGGPDRSETASSRPIGLSFLQRKLPAVSYNQTQNSARMSLTMGPWLMTVYPCLFSMILRPPI